MVDRFHVLAEFDEAKRSCRKKLADHNRRRRRKTQLPVTIAKSSLPNPLKSTVIMQRLVGSVKSRWVGGSIRLGSELCLLGGVVGLDRSCLTGRVISLDENCLTDRVTSLDRDCLTGRVTDLDKNYLIGQVTGLDRDCLTGRVTCLGGNCLTN
ncbi:hypothetical protein BHE74_00007875 [Ensete ventricosum]|nr:hypothetical protein BHE74_00007875 [Ensete ventricosum]